MVQPYFTFIVVVFESAKYKFSFRHILFNFTFVPMLSIGNFIKPKIILLCALFKRFRQKNSSINLVK
jgi:hypothetical protein